MNTEMNPQSVTTKQIVGSLKFSHWLAICTAASTVIGGIWSGGLWAGKSLADSQNGVQLVEAKSAASLYQAKLEMAQQKITLMESARVESQQALAKAQELLTRRDDEIVKLNVQLGHANTCKFLQEQIRQTKAEMEGTGDFIVYQAGKDWEEKQKARKAILEKRHEDYLQQLGNCAK